MSVFDDMRDMHAKYGTHDWMAANPQHHKEYLNFRIKFLNEELDETTLAFMDGDAEEVVDGLIDLIVVAAGTLDALGVDGQLAWDQVQKANMSKEVGVKPSRPNPLGLPDLIKPEGWQAPSHNGNHGYLTQAFEEND